MGTPIATNILESGHTLYVYNRTVSKTKPISDKGAIVSETIGSLAKECDIVFTIVSDDAALKEICESENGLLKNLKPGNIHVSMSTILPKTAEDLSALHQNQNQHYLAAPVFGRPEAAGAKKLNFAISGAEKIRNTVEPLLKDAGAVGVWHFGDTITAANTVKLCGNFLLQGALEAIGESISLGECKRGKCAEYVEYVSATLFNAPSYHNYAGIILNKKFEPAAFSATLGLKDLNLVLQQAAASNQAMPLAELLKKNMQQLVNSGKDQTDWSAVSTAVDKNT
ncbi:MAG: NAD(P)-dependent oxidoreductase [Bacteroidota bacterium]